MGDLGYHGKERTLLGAYKTTLSRSLGPWFSFALRLIMRLHHTKILLYTVVKISNHEKWKYTSINKLFLYLFVCEFLMLYYCNFNVEIAIWTYGIILMLYKHWFICSITINLDLFVQIYYGDNIYNIISWLIWD